jgi:hypothetical protein
MLLLLLLLNRAAEHGGAVKHLYRGVRTAVAQLPGRLWSLQNSTASSPGSQERSSGRATSGHTHSVNVCRLRQRTLGLHPTFLTATDEQLQPLRLDQQQHRLRAK